jgi:hypothetical protein
MYDYYLSGKDNFEIDRAAAEQVAQAMPEIRELALENRAFLRRAVRYLCETGVRQFIDLGSGIPTVGNVHEVAQTVHETAKVVYVDVDPVAYAHSRAILADNPHATVVRADLRQPAEVLADPQLRTFVDFDQPVGVLLVGVLHFVPDEERPADIVAGYASATVPGSHIVVSHASVEGLGQGGDEALSLYKRSSATMFVRSAEELTDILGTLDLVDPGVVRLAQWRPEPSGGDGTVDIPGLAAVGRRV